MKRHEAIDPGEVNIDRARLERAVEILRQGVTENVMPGAVVCAMRRGQMFLHEAVGYLDGERPVSTDTRYDLASLTKPIATATAVLTLVEQGRMTLEMTVPEIIGSGAASTSGVTVQHLLTHTSGLPAWSALYNRPTNLQDAANQILSLPFNETGTRYQYSCLGFILLARIVEAVSKRPFGDFVHDSVLVPFGLAETSFCPSPDLAEKIAPTVSREKTSASDIPAVSLKGTVHDGNARALGGISGNAGLFGTAHDVAVFGEAIRQGEQCRQRLFSAPTSARLLVSQIDPAVGAHTFMFFAQGNPLCPSGDLLSNRCVGHSGFTGTVLTIDPEYDLTVALLTNRVVTDPEGGRWLYLRRRFLNTLAAAIC